MVQSPWPRPLRSVPNPVEGLWQQLKHVELRNGVCSDLDELHLELDATIARLRQKSYLLPSSFEGGGYRSEDFA